MTRYALSLSGLAVLLAASSALAADPPYYTKKGTWHETLLASREALVQYEAEQAKKVEAGKPAKPADAGGPTLDLWHSVGPFVPPGNRKDFTYAFPPEKEAGLMAADEVSAELDGVSASAALAKSYGRLRWTPQPNYRDGAVHEMSAPTNGSTYLYRTIHAPSAMTITGYFGSDDGMRAWLNGKVIVSIDTPRGPSPNQNTAKLTLKKGANHLLLKIHNNSGGHGFYFHTQPNPVGGGQQKADPRQIARDGLWNLLRRDFRADHREMDWERQDGIWNVDWKAGDLTDLGRRYAAATRLPSMANDAKALLAGVKAPADLDKVRQIYYRSRKVEAASALVKSFNFKSLRLAIEDLTETYPQKYTRGKEFLQKLDALEQTIVGLTEAIAKGDKAATQKLATIGEDLRKLRDEALLANPLIDFDKLLLVKRKADYLGLPQNWQGNCAIRKNGYDDSIEVLSPVGPGGTVSTLHKPEKGEFVGDVDLHWDGDRMLFSSIGTHGRWQIFEIKADGTGLRQVNPGEHSDVDNYDACYLPDGRIIFDSTRCFHGVPCVGGGNTVANLCIMDADGKNIRQLCFDQDHNWCPTVLNNGRVLYTRWEYSDTPHYFSRLLFHMNPDGSEQMEYYGSNSYWPNSTFYARPVPGHPTKIVAIISGHHGVPRMGELVVFDPAKGRHEAGGAIQRIPGHEREVPPTIADGLVNGSWPKFLHPYPLSDKYFLVACQPTSRDNWGIYLVDTFDNMLLLRETPGYALLEPLPLRKTKAPPVIPSKIDTNKDTANVYLADVYTGDGLRNVPRGTVKKLRVYEFHFAYPRMGGHINIGIDGPWDVHRILGTVPVYEDGSAFFKVPSNIPVAVQPLDSEGRALQVMRSWYTTMPGENANCIGCHETQNTSPPSRQTVASRKAPVPITEWYGPARGFSFPRDVQPVLDKFCVGCHDGKESGRPNFADITKGWRGFTKSYIALHPFVRRPGPESDYHIQVPLEWHASTSELIQMLQKGHNGVKLDSEAWDRLYTWIDLNVPDHGTWGEHRAIASNMHEQRLEMRTKYAGRPEDPEKYPTPPPPRGTFVKPVPVPAPEPVKLAAKGWPFGADEAKARQAAAGAPAELKVPIAEGLTLDMVLVPAGQFIMGDLAGCVDEYPQAVVAIDQPFYMGKFEVTNQQYAAFDPTHDSAYISVFNKDHSNRGQAVNRSSQPVVRLSWQEAMAFCAWLTEKTGRTFTLPTEAQWEYACRAGTTTALSYGDVGADFGKLANLADSRVNELTIRDSPDWIPSIPGVNDGSVVTDSVGKYAPNAWGLCDMHGNAAEWTLSTYAAYPYKADGRDKVSPEGQKVVRGGSYYDRPKRARSAFRLSYPSWQRVHNVSFRVICGVDGKKVVLGK